VVSTPVRREQALFAHGRGVSLERACGLVRVARSSLRYRSRMATKDAPAIAAMRELSARYPRFGYRRIRIYLEREGHAMGMERAHRLWRQAGLQVPRKRPRRKVATTRPRPNAPTGPNQVWAYDFVFDRCANDQTLKCLTIVDEWLHECLAIDVQGGIRSARVIEVLSRLVSEHGAPRYLRSDNGPEFVSHAVLRWLQEAKIETALSDPGSPWQNGTNESFNGKFRDECLNMEWFRSRAEARVVIEQWRIHYNEDRPHSTLGYLTPMQFKQLPQPEGASK
jgi:putative transposase